MTRNVGPLPSSSSRNRPSKTKNHIKKTKDELDLKYLETFEKKYPVDTIVDGEVVNKNEYSLFVKIEDLDIDAFLHCNDLTYLNNGEEELSKYKKGDKLKVKVLEIKASEQKIRVGLRQTQPDPFDWFKDKKINQTITVKIISTDNKGLTVRPEGCEMNFQIKKSLIWLQFSQMMAFNANIITLG